jgi:hypothetical protein
MQRSLYCVILNITAAIRGGFGVSPIRAANLEFTLGTDRDRCTNFVGTEDALIST